jgi:hypothetical protein
MKLYELTGEWLSLMEMADDPELDEQAFQDTTEALEGDIDEKVENICKMIKNMEADADALKAEEKRLAARRKTLEGRIAFFKKYIYECMKAMGKVEAGGLIKAKIAKNGSVLPLVFKEGADPKDAPEAFVKVEYSFNNEAIRKALNDGTDLGFVEYGERGEGVRIK